VLEGERLKSLLFTGMSTVLESGSRPGSILLRGTAAGVADSLPDPRPIDSLCGAWWVVHTKARHEKALAADFDRMRIGYFLPLVSTRRNLRGRAVERQIPLFPSYLFLCGGEEERYATLMTHRAANVIPVADQEQLKRELRHIQHIMLSKQPVDLYPALKRGRRCRVVAGALAGIEGIVLRRRDKCRVYVGVEVLGQSAELEIDPGLLEVVE
jgi:hypothetical protein